MDAIKKAADFYVTKLKQNNSTPSKEQRYDEEIHRYISIAVKSVTETSGLFRNSCIFDSLIDALHACVSGRMEVRRVVKAYQAIEKCLCLLVLQPWKPEYKTLKTYGGFYTTNIKSVLPGAGNIFLSAGYAAMHNNTMVYRNNSEGNLLFLAFDCFVASEICIKISERFNQLKTVGGTLDDAVSDLLQKSWPADVSKVMPFIIESPVQFLPPEVPKRDPLQKEAVNFKLPTKTAGGAKTVMYPSGPPPMYDANISKQNPEESFGNFKFKRYVDFNNGISYTDEVDNMARPYVMPGVGRMPHNLQVEDDSKPRLKSDEGKYLFNSLVPGSHPASAITYPPGRLPHEKQYIGNVHETTMFGNGPLSKALLSNFQTSNSILNKAAFSDQGYGTGNDYSNTSTGQQPSQELNSETIYRPPLITADGKIIPQFPNSAKFEAPPPIPNRELKPAYSPLINTDGLVDCDEFIDSPNTDFMTAPSHYSQANISANIPNKDYMAPLSQYSQTNISSNIPNVVFMSPLSHCSPAIMPKNVPSEVCMIPQAPYSAPIKSTPQMRLIRPSPQSLKSNSWSPASKKVESDNRVSKSMDYAHRERCPICGAYTPSESGNCASCSRHIYGQSIGVPKKQCKTCTLFNDHLSTTCMACTMKLPEELTYCVP